MPSHAEINTALRRAGSADVHGPVSAALYLSSALPNDPGEALTQTGDTLQSSASRLAEFVLALDGRHGRRDSPVPYEVYMAALEAESAVRHWTEARRGS